MFFLEIYLKHIRLIIWREATDVYKYYYLFWVNFLSCKFSVLSHLVLHELKLLSFFASASNAPISLTQNMQQPIMRKCLQNTPAQTND